MATPLSAVHGDQHGAIVVQALERCDGGNITGPVTNATATILGANGYVAHQATDASGYALFSDVPATGFYFVFVTKPGFHLASDWTGDFSVTLDHDSVAYKSLWLSPAASACEITTTTTVTVTSTVTVHS